MLKAITLTLLVLILTISLAAAGDPDDLREGVTVHEWGTFTTVAGPDGQPADWLPLGGPADLPCFVDHFGGPLLKYSPPDAPLTYESARTSLKAKVRMETPVLYFYSPRQQTLNVRVDFPQGMITEWYPEANVVQPTLRKNPALSSNAGTRIEWNKVHVLPGTTPNLRTEPRPSHYYAARDTDSAPVQVNGKDEKFLFYRGVGSFPIPVSVRVTTDERIEIVAADQTIPAVILFENRGGKIGYQVARNLRGTTVLDPPALNGDFSSLQREMERTLIAQGLYAKEAHAMVETWRDSWFEEGTRIFYVLPANVVDSILPLRIEPAPVQTVRTFVGRVELITPATVKTVESALTSNDVATLAKYGRLLGPIAGRMEKSLRVRSLVDSAYRSFLGEVLSSCK